MELREVIKKRRSIRKFKDVSVAKERIEKLLKFAMWAPSGMNLQNWYFVVVTGNKKTKLVDIAKRAFDNYISKSLEIVFKEHRSVIEDSKRFFYTLGNAPLVVCAYTEHTIEGELTDIQAVAAAIENFLLLLTEDGLGGCWMTGPVHLETEINKLLGVNDKKLQAVIPVGIPDISPPVPKRKEGKLKWIGWD
ncbi:MAG: hypothetical protein B5M53_04670 [Candidatus Cloacimonas sp. 4484_209]|nr:MAG: hypothetical protein B5M53_04670 [Candidatus Cloacimonas sp. 4484_209]